MIKIRGCTAHKLAADAYDEWIMSYGDRLGDEERMRAIHMLKSRLREGFVQSPAEPMVLCDEDRPISSADHLSMVAQPCIRRVAKLGGPLLLVCGYQELYRRLADMHERLEHHLARARRDRKIHQLRNEQPWLRLKTPEERLHHVASSELYGVDLGMCERIVSHCSACREYALRPGKKRDAKKRTAEEAEEEAWSTVALVMGHAGPHEAKQAFEAKRAALAARTADDAPSSIATSLPSTPAIE